MSDAEITRIEYLVENIVEDLRSKEREYLERDVLNENDLVSGTMILGEMIQRGDIPMSKAMQIFPAIQNPYNEYNIKHVERNE